MSVSFDLGSRGLLRGRKLLRAVNGISFDIEAGQTLGVVGESGSGKSSAALATLRLNPLEAGTVHLGDTDITALSPRALTAARPRMQIVFQDPYASLDPSMRVGQLLAEPLLVHGVVTSTAERGRRVTEALEAVGLRAAHAARYPHEFSGGQRQRIAIARAMITRPEFVVLDEPVSALDVSTQSQIVNLLRRIQRESGTTFLFVSHDLAIVRIISHRTAVMYLGEIVEDGPSAELYDHPAHPYTAALVSAGLNADPNGTNARERIILRGDIPNHIDPPPGCRFHTRCPVAMDVCREQVPEPVPTAGGGTVRCHLHTEGPRLEGRTVLPVLSAG